MAVASSSAGTASTAAPSLPAVNGNSAAAMASRDAKSSTRATTVETAASVIGMPARAEVGSQYLAGLDRQGVVGGARRAGS